MSVENAEDQVESNISSLDIEHPEYVIDTTDLDNADELDTLDNSGVKRVEETERKKRSPKPYKEATTAARTKASLRADEISMDLFGIADEVDSLKTPLSEVLGDSMKKIREEIKGSNGFTSISTFTGCGGSDTGFAWAGFDPLLSVEFVGAARETLSANYHSYIVTPESLVEKAKGIAKDMGVELKLEKRRTVKKKVMPSSIDWPETLRPLNETQREKFRYEMTMEGLRQSTDRKLMPIFGDDIRGLSGRAVMDFLNIRPGDLGVFEGSPPCKSFSTAGAREDKWGQSGHYSDERHQTTDDLFWEYVRLLAEFKPKAFIAENVEGIGMGEAERQFLIPLMKQFGDLGYTTEARVVNSKDFGVPQSRPRMFFIGIRKDLLNADGRSVQPKFPQKWSDMYTVRDALELASPMNEEDNLKKVTLDPEKYEIARIWHKLGYGDSPSNKAFQTVRAHPDRPSPTITATSAGNQPAAGVLHPDECRKFTIPEYRALFGFPLDYQFTGDYDQQGERMGRSVPPLLMKQLAESIAESLKTAVNLD